MISPLHFAKRDQVVLVKFKLGMKVERVDMMHLQAVSFVPTGDTSRLAESMLLFHPFPLGATCMPMFVGDFPSMVMSSWHTTAPGQLRSRPRAYPTPPTSAGN